MIHAPETAESETVSVGLQAILTELVRKALRDSPDIVSMAVGDRQGLPIINATRGAVPVMTVTAMATMSMKAARTAAEAVGMDPPEHMTVHTAGGSLVILGCGESQATLVGQLRESANLGLALVVLRRLAAHLSETLSG